MSWLQLARLTSKPRARAGRLGRGPEIRGPGSRRGLEGGGLGAGAGAGAWGWWGWWGRWGRWGRRRCCWPGSVRPGFARACMMMLPIRARPLSDTTVERSPSSPIRPSSQVRPTHRGRPAGRAASASHIFSTTKYGAPYDVDSILYSQGFDGRAADYGSYILNLNLVLVGLVR
eukprot:SAG31_NODE_3010_length_4788_cov_4.266098_2_plen_173_part_00